MHTKTKVDADLYNDSLDLESPDTTDGMRDEDRLRVLVDMRFGIQKLRIATGNRIAAFYRNNDDVNETGSQYVTILDGFHEQFKDIESNLDFSIRKVSKDYPVIQAFASVKGVGEVLAAQTISLIDIGKADTVSALWRYAGYAVLDGERERLKRGERSHFNTRLKSVCYKVSCSMMRCGSPYRRVYDTAHEFYTNAKPEWTKLHVHNAAIRKMTKMWLSHLWEAWRRIDGLPIREVYVAEKLGHKNITRPEDFGWNIEP